MRYGALARRDIGADLRMEIEKLRARMGGHTDADNLQTLALDCHMAGDVQLVAIGHEHGLLGVDHYVPVMHQQAAA